MLNAYFSVGFVPRMNSTPSSLDTFPVQVTGLMAIEADERTTFTDILVLAVQPLVPVAVML